MFCCDGTEGGCLKETGSYDNLCAVVNCLSHCGNTVIIVCVRAVCGLIILDGDVVFLGVGFSAFPSSLVESLVVDLSYISNNSDLIGFFATGCHGAKDAEKHDCAQRDAD